MSIASDYVTLVEAFELTVPPEEAFPLMRGLIARLEKEGVPSLVSMQFYTSDVPNQIGAVIRFSSSDQMIEHMSMISSWPEFERFATLFKLIDMKVFGTLVPEAEAWIRKFQGPLRKHDALIAGFIRSA